MLSRVLDRTGRGGFVQQHTECSAGNLLLIGETVVKRGGRPARHLRHRGTPRLGAQQAMGVLERHDAYPYRRAHRLVARLRGGARRMGVRSPRAEGGPPRSHRNTGRQRDAAPSLGDRPAQARARHLSIDIDEVTGGTRLRAEIPGASVDVIAARPAGHESLAVVVPWSDRRFQYTVKDIGRPPPGASPSTALHDVPVGGARSRPRALDLRCYWNWGAGSACVSEAVLSGVQARWAVDRRSDPLENAIFIDGGCTSSDTGDYLRPGPYAARASTRRSCRSTTR